MDFFNGADNKLSKEEVAAMEKQAQRFDSSNEGNLDRREMNDFLSVVEYFAGPDHDLQIESDEYKDMNEIVHKAAGADVRMQHGEAVKLLQECAALDPAKHGYLDKAMRAALRK